MRNRKGKLVAGLVVVELTMVAVVTMMLTRFEPPSRISQERFRRIERGMTRAEVESILGPPGDYRTGPTEVVVPRKPGEWDSLHAGSETRRLVWRGNEADFYLFFDARTGVLDYAESDKVEKLGQTQFESFFWSAKRHWQLWLLGVLLGTLTITGFVVVVVAFARNSRPANRETAVRRRRLLATLAGLLVALVALAMVLAPRSVDASRVTRENCRRIRSGMTRAEVEAILGPAGDYRTGETEHDASEPLDLQDFGEDNPSVRIELWQGDAGAMIVGFDASGRAANGWFSANRRSDDAIRNFRWRLKRQWHRWFPE